MIENIDQLFDQERETYIDKALYLHEIGHHPDKSIEELAVLIFNTEKQ